MEASCHHDERAPEGGQGGYERKHGLRSELNTQPGHVTSRLVSLLPSVYANMIENSFVAPPDTSSTICRFMYETMRMKHTDTMI